MNERTRDHWDSVFDELGRRPLVKLAVLLLVLVHALAIYAPLIASDRPYFLEAVDNKAYDGARRSLAGVAASLHGLAEEGPAAYAAARAERPAAPAFDEAVALERNALALRLATMRAYLPHEKHAVLDELEASAEDVERRVTSGGDSAGALDAARALQERARALRRAYEVRSEGAPEGEGVELVGRISYPLFEAITSYEVFFMVLWALLLTGPLWNLVVNALVLRGSDERRRRARRAKLLAVLSLSLAAALVWSVTVGGGAAFDVSGYKQGLTEGKIVATRVVFPPLAIGFAETHVEEPYRPPTWTAASEIDDRGSYVRGPRVPEPDPITGVLPVESPVQVRFGEPGRNVGWRHLLGTDETGRDMFVRLLFGARISLAVGLVSTVILVLIGLSIGALAGYAGGRTDLLLSRLIEIVQSVPAFFLILTAVAIVPTETLHPLFAIVLFIGVVRWTGIARLVRAEFLKLKEQEFVLAARATGLSPARVVLRHVLPNAMGPVLVAIAFSIAAGILTESAVSFLGFGVQEPIPSWGSLLSESRAAEHWWIQVFPGLAIFATVLSYNLVGEGVRDALDPRMSSARVAVER